MSFVLPPPSVPALPIAGSSDLFPVGRIFCVGQNYADHVREMGGDPNRGTPIFFDKPASCIVNSPATLDFPSATTNLHHEVELAVALRSGGHNLSEQQAEDTVYGYACSLDMTRRDLQAEAKAGGKPWDMAKGFDESAPCGPLLAMPGKALDQGSITLSINGEPRQSGDLNQMVWSVTEIIVALSKLVALRPCDLILTGTPAGVSQVHPGDHLVGSIKGVGDVAVTYRSSPETGGQ